MADVLSALDAATDTSYFEVIVLPRPMPVAAAARGACNFEVVVRLSHPAFVGKSEHAYCTDPAPSDAVVVRLLGCLFPNWFDDHTITPADFVQGVAGDEDLFEFKLTSDVVKAKAKAEGGGDFGAIPVRAVPAEHAADPATVRLLGTGSQLLDRNMYGAPFKVLADPKDNGGWCEIGTSPVALARGVAQERARLKAMRSIGKATIPALMNELENLGHRPAPQPEGLTVTMRAYQLATLGFLVDQERLEGGAHRHFWAPVAAPVPEGFILPSSKPSSASSSSSSFTSSSSSSSSSSLTSSASSTKPPPARVPCCGTARS